MADSIRSISSDYKRKLREMKTVPAKVKTVVYAGVRRGAPGVTLQFHKDVGLYNLFEALLYVESYEKEGYYADGTAWKAATEAVFGKEAE